MEVIFLIIGLAAGAVIGWLIGRLNANGSAEDRIKYEGTLRDLGRSEELLAKERDKAVVLGESLATAEAEMRHLQERLDTERQSISHLEKRFQTEFENVANRLLEEKSQKFTERNRANMDQILSPLREKIGTFEKAIEERYVLEMKDKESLRTELRQLFELNAKISEEAHNLTRALKGDNRQQGNWGEVILERVLERSGLERGREFELQVSVTGDEGDRFRPDAIIYLPEDKHIVIDSKVSLIDFEAMVNALEEGERQSCAARHVGSVRSHIKGLSEKRYHHSEGLSAPEMTLLFMPIEAAFGAALQQDVGLFAYAWERQVVLVSPSTLLATLRTVASIWKHDRQTRNAIEIAEESGKLYDKFVGFVEDLQKVGQQLDRSKDSWEGAMNKLRTGKGNLMSRAERMRELGAKANKSLDAHLPPSD